MNRLFRFGAACSALSAAVSGGPSPAGEARPDVVVADFEGDTYGVWVATGSAFGRGPARGALPGQMEVTGFQGRGLVNSFAGGDGSTGTLTSPPFRVERKYLNFLIGGGGFPGETCLDLLVGGEVVRTASGPNVEAGGSERLDGASWDLGEFAGKEAALRVVDRRTGGWGHINVDQVVQSDTPRGVVPASRALVAGKRYLDLPVSNSAPPRRVRVSSGKAAVREFDIKLAEGTGDFRVSCDLGPFRGERLTVEAPLPAGSEALAALTQEDEPAGAGGHYREADRPQFHFSARRGWLNDPNGLVWFEGEFHLFFQHNPYGWDWGNMHWGHAVSPDLVHWNELGEALTPRKYGDWCFSGSAVVDHKNTSGFGKGGAPPLVLAYTSTGRGECVAYSRDRGRTWTEYEGNPVVKHQGRDPRLLWHGGSGRWVMAVYDEAGGRQAIAFHTSPDLKAWTPAGRVDGFFECPDLFEMAVEGAPGRKLWALHGADGKYLLGRFDGADFRPERPEKQTLWYGDFYAAQTFSDAPDGRRVQVGWARNVTFPGMPFNQQMTVPCALTLRVAAEGVRLCALPVAELAGLRGETTRRSDFTLKAGENPLAGLVGDLYDLSLVADLGGDGVLTADLRGLPVVADAGAGTLTVGGHRAPLVPEDGRVTLRLLVDRGSVEVFAQGGRVAVSSALPRRTGKSGYALSTRGPSARLRSLEVSPMTSSWR